MQKYFLVGLFTCQIFFGITQELGLRSGFVISQFRDIDFDGDQLYFGFNAAFGLNYCITNHFFLSSDAGYVNAGGRGETYYQDNLTHVSQGYSAKISMDFVSLNTLANYSLGLGDRAHLFLGAGPRVDILTGYRVKGTHNNVMAAHAQDDEICPIIYGVVGRMGYKFDFKKFFLGCDLQYNYNLTGLIQGTDYSKTYTSKVQYANVGLFAGIRFN